MLWNKKSDEKYVGISALEMPETDDQRRDRERAAHLLRTEKEEAARSVRLSELERDLIELLGLKVRVPIRKRLIDLIKEHSKAPKKAKKC